MKPLVSIIIPCYNSGKYLPDAIRSVHEHPDKTIHKIIIVDDGSTDEQTLLLLNQLAAEGITVIHQENRGPAAARNTGVMHAQTKYLLFLDSDNKIRYTYIDKGIDILDKHKDVGVVHGNAAFFGTANKPRFSSRPFDMTTMLFSNYIDVCSVIRKKVWEDAGKFDEKRILFGHEDWDFWLRVADTGWKFHYVNEELFDYRVRENSLLIQSSGSDNIRQMMHYVYSKNMDIVMKEYRALYREKMLYQKDKERPLRSFAKFMYRKYFKKD
ncbi:MAG: glycosyltransferase family A protein [Chitinophagaceae bacterium]